MSSPAPVALKLMRSHFLGGRDVDVDGLPVKRQQVVSNAPAREIDMNGSYCAGQIYAQEFRLAEPRHAAPILLWHGGGMTGAQWETTPDGRPGWLWRFLQAGYDVFVADAPERGRASWAMFPQVYHQAPVFRSKEEAWRLFRIGADFADRKPYAAQQFPIEAFDVFARQFVPRWLDHEDLALEGYRELLRLTGPAIVVAHSQGGGFAAQLAAENPAGVAAVVGIEPTGMPSVAAASAAAGAAAIAAASAAAGATLDAASGVWSARPHAAPPHLAIWGDHFPQSPLWQAYRERTQAYWRTLRAQGLRADEIDLPAAGMPGNSHFCMLDRNSDLVADRILQWLDQVVVQPTIHQP